MDLSQIPMQLVFMGIIIILIGRFISNFAHSTPARLFWVVLGLYFLSFRVNLIPLQVTLDFDFFLSVGFIIPHVRYFIEYFTDFFKTTIAVTYNLYTLWLTIYYKTRNVFSWLFKLFKKKNKSDSDGYSYKEQKFGSGQKQNNYYEKQEYKNEYKQESSSNHYEQKQQSSYKESNKQQNSYNSTSNNPFGAEYNQFYQAMWYQVLGVNVSADKTTIKKAYRSLSKQYHPDTVHGKAEYDAYENVFKRINEAYQNSSKLG